MKRKLYLMRCLKMISLIFPILICVGFSQTYLFTFADHNRICLEGFYHEPKNTVDVVFLGASDVFTGISSSYIYEQSGITSFPYAVDSSPISVYKSQISEIMSKQTPKLLVIEVFGAVYNDPAKLTDEIYLRKYLDSIPNSINKYQTILELVPPDQAYSFFFPIAKYHDNWKNTDQIFSDAANIVALQQRGYSLLKGNLTLTSTESSCVHRDVSNDFSMSALEEKSEQYLLELLDYLKENDITNVVFTRLPHIISTNESYKRFQRGNSVEQIIKDHGYDFINLEREYGEIGLDFSKDFYNIDHLNIYGQQKLSAYFSNLLTERFHLSPTELTPRVCAQWDESVRYLHTFYRYAEEKHKSGEEVWLWENTELIASLDAFK